MRRWMIVLACVGILLGAGAKGRQLLHIRPVLNLPECTVDRAGDHRSRLSPYPDTDVLVVPCFCDGRTWLDLVDASSTLCTDPRRD